MKLCTKEFHYMSITKIKKKLGLTQFVFEWGIFTKKNVRNFRMLFFKNKTILMLRNNVELSSNLMQKFKLFSLIQKQ